jgi:hypothetical protein
MAFKLLARLLGFGVYHSTSQGHTSKGHPTPHRDVHFLNQKGKTVSKSHVSSDWWKTSASTQKKSEDK